MTDIAVHVESVSKLYRIGAKIDSRSLRETVTDLVRLRRRASEDGERDLWALNDVSFQVRHGEAVGIIGQNGAGKSTLLKILSRITEPTKGRVVVSGRVSSLLEVGTGFHGELSGRENIQLNGAILGMTRAEIRQRFDAIVAFAEVDRFIDTPVKYYSSGMYMRLAFAVAAHLEPEILIVDEVLAVGDAAFQAKCLRKMGEVAAHGRTVLFVSHNMPAVRALCERAVVLSGGRVVDEGTSAAVVTRYLQRVTSPAGRDDLARQIAGLKPDPSFRLLSVRLLQMGNDVATISNGEPLQIRIDFEVLSPTMGLHVYFQLLDLEDTVIIESIHNGDTGEMLVLSAGLHEATATIPANFLAPRPYQLRVLAGVANVRSCVGEGVRLTFDVEQTGIVNSSYPGYETPARLAPHLDWIVTVPS